MNHLTTDDIRKAADSLRAQEGKEKANCPVCQIPNKISGPLCGIHYVVLYISKKLEEAKEKL